MPEGQRGGASAFQPSWLSKRSDMWTPSRSLFPESLSLPTLSDKLVDQSEILQ